MTRRLRAFALLLACVLPPGSGALARVLAPEIEQALAREGVPIDAVSVVVQEAGSGQPQVSLNATRPVNPASLAKLLITYAALDELGPAFTWKTPVWFGGPVKDGVLDGPLVLQGRGDPKLSLERLWLALQRVRQMGVTEIRGDIVLDQGAFVVPPGSPGDFDNEPLRPYNTRPQALLLNLSTVVYTFTPDVARGVATVSAEPALDALLTDPTVPLSSGPCNDWRATLKASLGDPVRLQFGGSFPVACGERVWPLAHADARLYAQRLIATLWRAAGGRLTGSVVEGSAPQGLAPIFELTSPPLADVVRDINKFSNNVMAQQLFFTFALQRSGAASVGVEDARAALRRWLADRLGESPESMAGVVIDSGSGLSRETRVSARLLAHLLQRAWSSPVMPELMASLPVTGLDGTLRRSRATVGRAHLKTGSLRDVAGLAGYVLGASGRRYVLVAVINHPNANAARPALDALVQWTMNDLNPRFGTPRP
jgi:D-alanyl-D-alanine carboxypeptidase/D-alanyl-D-alanine-endopeptidase (penicillin-binding protein 4)